MSDLQLSLIVLGGAAVLGVFAYNKWQERQAQRKAERAFRSEHADVLLEPGPPGAGPPERIEPVIVSEQPPVEEESAPLQVAPVMEEPAPSAGPAHDVLLPVLDRAVDCIVGIEAADPISSPLLWEAQGELWRHLGKPVLWFGLNETKLQWDQLSRHSAGAYRRLAAGMQLADRRGPVSDADLSLFLEGLQKLAGQFLMVADFPNRADVQAAAGTLDQFCAGVDVQIGINVVSTEPTGFAGTKLRGVAEAGGFILRDDGSFHMLDDVGRTLFTLSNLETSFFVAEELRSLTTHGITLSLDVPRVPNGGTVFNRMIVVAQQLAAGLHGAVVDDNRAPLNESSLHVIRSKIVEFQQTMAHYGIPAGGPLALRLFQ
jgi:FtsZ-interacting cell division protein ZipA